LIGGTWQTAAPERSSSSALNQFASVMVVLPVFVQAPWVRLHPFSAVLFTSVFLSLGLILHLGGTGRRAELGSLLVGFSGSWLAGCLFWGWLRAHPAIHLPIEAFALPLGLAGLRTRWHLAAGFYLASLLGTACTDLMMLISGVMPFWPLVVNAPIGESSLLLRSAAEQVLQPPVFALLGLATSLILVTANQLKSRARKAGTNGECMSMAAAVLTTTLWVDGLFLLAALLQPGMSGLI
tara:strand:+ start:5063 stop:5776 length:714 start_codon:yes stop_codon:yes gene_type:complete